jgi:hypothetical protein
MLLCTDRTDFTAFPCLWRKDRQSLEVSLVADLQRAIRGSQSAVPILDSLQSDDF